MGEARNRGTREERVRQAIGRKQLERETLRLAAVAEATAHWDWLATLTPEQRTDFELRLEERRLRQVTLAGLAAGTVGVVVP